MKTQIDALRLALLLEQDPSEWVRLHAAAELRRLNRKSEQDDETIQWQASKISKYLDKITELEAENMKPKVKV